MTNSSNAINECGKKKKNSKSFENISRLYYYYNIVSSNNPNYLPISRFALCAVLSNEKPLWFFNLCKKRQNLKYFAEIFRQALRLGMWLWLYDNSMKVGVLFLDVKCLETDVIGMLIRIDQRFMNRFCMKKPPQFVILL